MEAKHLCVTVLSYSKCLLARRSSCILDPCAIYDTFLENHGDGLQALNAKLPRYTTHTLHYSHSSHIFSSVSFFLWNLHTLFFTSSPS